MFRSSRDIAAYLREWRDLSDASRENTLEALDCENTILLEQYVFRGYAFTRKVQEWEKLRAELPAARRATLLWRKDLEEHLYNSKTLTMDTGRRRREYEEVLEQLERKRLVLEQEARSNAEEIQAIWDDLLEQILFTRELGERMTWLRDACRELVEILSEEVYGEEEHFSGSEEETEAGQTADPMAWMECVGRMSRIIYYLGFWANMELKSAEEVLGIVLLMTVYEHAGSSRWFLYHGFREEEIPSVEEWEASRDIAQPHYRKLLESSLLRRAFGRQLLYMEDASQLLDRSAWDMETILWHPMEYGLYHEEADMDLPEVDVPIPREKRGPKLVERKK